MAPLSMDALQYDRSALKIKQSKIPVPTGAQRFEVIVKVAYAGVCGTDIHIIEGRFPCLETRPFVLGHEMSGVVAEVGADVTHVKVGDKVAVDPNRTCHTCDECSTGQYNTCKIAPARDTIGIFKDGAIASFVRVPADQVHRLPEDMSLKQGVLCEPMSCVAHCWDRLQPVAMGSTILITGAGIIGNLCCASAHFMGHRKIILSEPSAGRRAIAAKLGLDGVKVVAPEELQAMKAKDPNFGADVVIECSGAIPAMETGFDLLKPSGKLIIFGIPAPDRKMSINPFQIYQKELTVLGNTMNPYTMKKSINFVNGMGDMLDFTKVGIKVYKLSQYEEAFAELKKGSVSKAVFEIGA